MAQNETISLSLANKIDVLNKTQSLDARYGVYDSEEEALEFMDDYGLDGRQVAVYTDKDNGKVQLYLYNKVLHQLEPISGGGGEAEWDNIGGDQSDVNISGFTNDSGFVTSSGVTSVSGTANQISSTGGNTPVLSLDDDILDSLELANSAVQPGDLGTVATSNSYDDLDNLPTIPAQVNLIEGSNITIVGTYPNLTLSASGTVGTNWENIGGDQSNINISGFENDAEYITLEDIPPQQFQENITVSLSNGKTMGKYLNGETIPAQGKTFEEVLRDIAIETQFPTFVNPTFSLAHNQTSGSGLREVGSSINVLLTATFNRGQIVGDIVGGVWNPSVAQDFRTGTVVDYIIAGTNTDVTNTRTITGYTVISGNNTFSSTVNYNEGPQPLDSSGNNYMSTYLAGNMSANTQFTGIYPIFWFKSSSPISAADMQTAIANGDATKIIVSSTGTIRIPFNAAGEYLAVAYPDTSTTKTKWWVNALDSGDIPGGVFGAFTRLPCSSPTGLWSGVDYKIHVSPGLITQSNQIELRNS